jgi:hypothetical protein
MQDRVMFICDKEGVTLDADAFDLLAQVRQVVHRTHARSNPGRQLDPDASPGVWRGMGHASAVRHWWDRPDTTVTHGFFQRQLAVSTVLGSLVTASRSRLPQ